MVTEKRYEIILELLKNKGVVQIHELMEATKSSESTIRRDLSYLESQKLLKRFHGGAKPLEARLKELSFKEKSSKNIEKKQKLGIFAASLVNDDECIFIDAGTTTYEIIPHLNGKNIFVVTNGLNHIDALIENNIPCYMIGGKVKLTTKAVVGGDALRCLDKFRFDKCFLGANGIDDQFGLTTPDTEEAILKNDAIRLSKQSYVIVDDSKFGEVSSIKFGEISDCTIITNEKPRNKSYDKITEIKVANI